MRKQNNLTQAIFSRFFSPKKSNYSTKNYKDYNRLVDHFIAKLQVD